MVSEERASEKREAGTGDPAVDIPCSAVVNRARSNLVIGLTGPFGSGCSTMRDLLAKEFHFHPFKVSDDIRTELERDKSPIRKGQPDW
jgi:putative protein kinase ArgK-like GTPase of G3E family